MSTLKHITIEELPELSVIKFTAPKYFEVQQVIECGEELFHLTDVDKRKNLLLDFRGVIFLSSRMINNLIVLNKKVRGIGGKLRFSNMAPEVYDVFVITRLNTVFDIKGSREDAIAAFS